MLVEAKTRETSVDPSLLYFWERLRPRFAFQVVLGEDILNQVRPGIFVIDLYRFLTLLV